MFVVMVLVIVYDLHILTICEDANGVMFFLDALALLIHSEDIWMIIWVRKYLCNNGDDVLVHGDDDDGCFQF
ncbi:hypothetical protein ZWY2020_048070 [Hordeum vulgare]|nr:hypothetical protein ZWY2020_048070 [Hordeum vulgare]